MPDTTVHDRVSASSRQVGVDAKGSPRGGSRQIPEPRSLPGLVLQIDHAVVEGLGDVQ